ncbi:toxin [candidate division WWE3 bacterium CG08_land_8_20_14_0_20_41_15]|uniref:Toxin n=1 Tax=candidate division WWE3 bacterium CG08_land_8_20_14_0_20_41_15 TaxID=1975086 RepID=A0A2H0XA65_UNCKA|nr:MAG: toxin [candidate division WWE3 bacterium CG08_land_8_20_14_0_20_41_15]
MKYIDWNEEKNKLLRSQRDVSFEDIVVSISEGGLLDILENKNSERYPNQKIFVVNIRNYGYLVPFTEDEEKIFLKTIIPSRKATKEYLVKKKGGKSI